MLWLILPALFLGAVGTLAAAVVALRPQREPERRVTLADVVDATRCTCGECEWLRKRGPYR